MFTPVSQGNNTGTFFEYFTCTVCYLKFFEDYFTFPAVMEFMDHPLLDMSMSCCFDDLLSYVLRVTTSNTVHVELRGVEGTFLRALQPLRPREDFPDSGTGQFMLGDTGIVLIL